MDLRGLWGVYVNIEADKEVYGESICLHHMLQEHVSNFSMALYRNSVQTLMCLQPIKLTFCKKSKCRMRAWIWRVLGQEVFACYFARETHRWWIRHRLCVEYLLTIKHPHTGILGSLGPDRVYCWQHHFPSHATT